MSREYPKAWSTFERKLTDGKLLKFTIEDIPENRWLEAVEFMLGSYIREDVWWVTAGTAQEPEAVEEYRVLLKSIIKHRMSLACFVEDGNDRTLVGVNMCMPQDKDHFVEHVPPKSKAGLLSLCMFSEAIKVTAIYDKYEVSKYLMGAGLSVRPDYRGHGVAVELLRARFQVARELNFNVTGGIFTSASAQRSAERAEMECVYETPYVQFGERCNVEFISAPEYLKLFAKKVI